MDKQLMDGLIEILRYYSGALNLSDPDHEDFADSCADVVELLWQRGEQARTLLAQIDHE